MEAHVIGDECGVGPKVASEDTPSGTPGLPPRPFDRNTESIDWGSFRTLKPICDLWGMDRGIPIDRYYINKFLQCYARDIRGRVLEVKDRFYTSLYGSEVTQADAVDIDPSNNEATVITDLGTPQALPADYYDCFILTQTIHVIYDVPQVIANAYRTLRPGGVVLASLPCVSRIDPESGLRGDFWRFTPASARRLFGEQFPAHEVDVSGFGNVLSCMGFLYGLSAGELSVAELNQTDEFFPLLTCVSARKPCG